MESEQETSQPSPAQSGSDVERTQTFIQPSLPRESSIGSTSALTTRPEVHVVCWPLKFYWKKTLDYNFGNYLNISFSSSND